MLTSNTMRFCTDVFGMVTSADDTSETIGAAFVKKALLASKTALDCENKSAIEGILITGTEPSGTKRRFMFQAGNKVYRFVNSVMTEYAGDVTVDNVLSAGNSAAELNALTNIVGFAGKKIYPIIALSAPSDADDFPTAKVAIKGTVTNDTLTKTLESIVYDLTTEEATPRITEITADYNLKGNATCNALVKLKDSGGTWSSYMSLADAADKEAKSIQFKITYKVTTTDGTDEARCDMITVSHTLGKTVVNGTDADLYTAVVNYDNDLRFAHCTVRHNALLDSAIEAYVNFMSAPKRRDCITIGTASGGRQELTLGVGGADERINTSTLELCADGSPVTNFSYNSAVSSVVISEKQGKVITASYEYETGMETWRKMALDMTEPYGDDTFMSRFTYELDDTEGMTHANFRIKMKRNTGKVTNQSLGKATGKKQTFVLEHAAKMSTIKFSAAVDWEYTEANQIITLVAAKNTDLKISYSYVGSDVIIYSFAGGLAVA